MGKKEKKKEVRPPGTDKPGKKNGRREKPSADSLPFAWNPRHTRIALALILSASFLLGIVSVLLFRHSPFFNLPIIDEESYVKWADEIAGGEWIGTKVFYQDPLYPYFLAVVFKVFGRSFLVVRLLQVAMGTLSVAVVFLAARRLLPEPAALAAAGILAMYRGLYFFELQILKETMVILLSAVSCLWGMTAAEKPAEQWRWLALGLTLGLLTLLRGNFQVILPFLLLWVVFSEKGVKLLSRLTRAGIFGLGIALVITPVTIRNYKIGGEFVLTTSQGGANFYIGNNERANGRYVTLPFVRANPEWEAHDFKAEAEKQAGRPLTPSEVSHFWFRESFAWIHDHPLSAFLLTLHKARLMIHQYEIPDNHSLYLTRQEFVPALYLAFLGFGILWGPALLGMWILRGDPKSRYPALFSILYTASIIPFFIVDRYRLAVVPALAVFSAAFLFWTHEKWKKRETRPLLWSAVILLPALFLGLLPTSESRAPMGMEYYLLGNAYLKTDQPHLAIPWYDKAIKALPDNQDVARNREEALRRLNTGDISLILAEGQKPEKTGEELVTLGQKLETLGQIKSAAAFYEKALAKNPSLFSAHARLGFLFSTYPEIKDSQKALLHLKLALQLRPNDLDTMNALGNANFLAGDTIQARHWWEKALRLDPSYKSAKTNLEVLEKKQAQKK